jgi:hypothetical protein
MFQGAIHFEPAERVWRTWTTSKCRFFIWLVEHNMCWTSDKLAKRGTGMDHPEQCPLCDQQAETINHLLVSCIFARQVWTDLFQPVGLLEFVPQLFKWLGRKPCCGPWPELRGCPLSRPWEPQGFSHGCVLSRVLFCNG